MIHYHVKIANDPPPMPRTWGAYCLSTDEARHEAQIEMSSKDAPNRRANVFQCYGGGDCPNIEKKLA